MLPLVQSYKKGPIIYYDHRAGAGWRAAGAVSHAEYRSRVEIDERLRIPFLGIPGFKHTLIAIDDMHANDQGLRYSCGKRPL